MIDTTTIQFPVLLTSKQLQHWIGHPLIFPDGRTNPKYFLNPRMNNGTVISFRYYPPNPPFYSLPWLGIQVSLPNVLFGNNIQTLKGEADFKEAIYMVNQFLERYSWLPNIDFGLGFLWRVDLVYDHHVGERVQDYVRALFKLDYPSRKTLPYPHEGVQFKSGVATTKFYDKWFESSLSPAYGTMRQETTLRHTYYIGRRMGIQYPTLKDISIPWVTKVLQEDLQKLHLQSCIISDRSTALIVLEQKYGWKQGDKLFGHLYARQSVSRKQMIADGKSERTIRKYEGQITNAGVSLTITDDGMQLAPLEIRMTGGTDVPDSLSDT
jgi:hypothetical protein